MKENKIPKPIIIVAILLALVIGVTYAVTTFSFESTQSIRSGKITFKYIESNESLNITGEDSITDEEGKIKPEYFPFSIESNATGKTKIAYYIYFTEESDNTLPNDAVKLYLTRVNDKKDEINQEAQVLAPTLISSLPTFNKETLTNDENSKDHFIFSDSFNLDNSTETHNYRLRIWIDDNYDFSNEITNTTTDDTTNIKLSSKTFKLKINVYGYDGDKINITK